MSSIRLRGAGLWLAVLALANALILAADSPPLTVLGISVVFAWSPGLAAVTLLFPSTRELDRWERVALGYALGLFGSVLVVWLYMLVPGRVETMVLLALLDLLSLALGLPALWRLSREPQQAPAPWRLDREALAGLVLLAVSVLLLFHNLGYTELDYDEAPVVTDAVAAILGNERAPFALLKGPTQIIVTVVQVLLSGSLDEGSLRLPFTLCAVAGALLLWRLARRLLGRAGGLAVLALWTAEGVHLSEGRWLQFQSLVTLAALSAVLCFVHAVRVPRARRRFQWAGVFILASGAFAHYDGAFAVPVIGLLWLWMERDALRRRATWLHAAALGALGALIAGPFYVSLSLQGETARRLDRYYFGLRVGRGPYNSIQDFAGRMFVLDAPAWLIGVSAGLLLAGLFAGRRIFRHDRRAGIAWFVALAAAVVSTIWPDALSLADVNLAFVPFGVLLALLAFVPRVGLPVRVAGVWALGAWFFPAFWMQTPGDHYYAALPGLALAAVWGWARMAGVLARRRPVPAARAGAVALALIVSVTGALYLVIVLDGNTPEYLHYGADMPVRPLTPFVFDRPALLYGAYPHQSGWRAVAALYDRGILRGEFTSNETRTVADWYLARTWNPPQSEPRYYMRVVHPFAPILGSDVPADLEQTHWLAARITVNGEPRMLVYQRRDGDAPPVVQAWSVEALSGDWHALATLERFTRYKDNGRDDSAFYDVARMLTTSGRPGDAVLVDDAIGRGLLARWYGGNMPLAVSMDDPAVQRANRVWGVYWAALDRDIERELSATGCPATATWYKNVRVVLNGAASLGASRTLDASFGSVARLRSAASGGDPTPGGVLCVQLDWLPLAQTAERYKTFVHLMDSAGRVVAQTDAEPLAGFMSTDQWQPAAAFADRRGIVLPADLPPGAYTVMTGLYRPSDGARLPAVDAQGRRYPDDAVDLGPITIN